MRMADVDRWMEADGMTDGAAACSSKRSPAYREEAEASSIQCHNYAQVEVSISPGGDVEVEREDGG